MKEKNTTVVLGEKKQVGVRAEVKGLASLRRRELFLRYNLEVKINAECYKCRLGMRWRTESFVGSAFNFHQSYFMQTWPYFL